MTRRFVAFSRSSPRAVFDLAIVRLPARQSHPQGRLSHDARIGDGRRLGMSIQCWVPVHVLGAQAQFLHGVTTTVPT